MSPSKILALGVTLLGVTALVIGFTNTSVSANEGDTYLQQAINDYKDGKEITYKSVSIQEREIIEDDVTIKMIEATAPKFPFETRSLNDTKSYSYLSNFEVSMNEADIGDTGKSVTTTAEDGSLSVKGTTRVDYLETTLHNVTHIFLQMGYGSFEILDNNMLVSKMRAIMGQSGTGYEADRTTIIGYGENIAKQEWIAPDKNTLYSIDPTDEVGWWVAESSPVGAGGANFWFEITRSGTDTVLVDFLVPCALFGSMPSPGDFFGGD